jgi:transcriptional regulator with XRE-family HTH domain
MNHTIPIFQQVTDAIKGQLRDGRTQQQVADELGVHQTTISAIAGGRRRLGRHTLEAIVKANPPWLWDILQRAGR